MAPIPAGLETDLAFTRVAPHYLHFCMFRGFLSSSRIGRTPSQSQPTSGWRCCVAHRRLPLPLQPSPQTPPRTPLERPARESSQNSSSRATVLGSSTIRNSQSPLINSTPRQRSPLLEFLPRVLPELEPPAASTGPSWCYGAVSQSVPFAVSGPAIRKRGTRWFLPSKRHRAAVS